MGFTHQAHMGYNVFRFENHANPGHDDNSQQQNGDLPDEKFN
jgi:hypothetical protein